MTPLPKGVARHGFKPPAYRVNLSASRSQSLGAGRTMSETTLDVSDRSAEWVAECPRCQKQTRPRDFPCPNCRKPSFEYFREWHSTLTRAKDGDGEVRHRWTECGLSCPNDHTKLKTFPCSHRCGGIITVSCINVLMHMRRYDWSENALWWDKKLDNAGAYLGILIGCVLFGRYIHRPGVAMPNLGIMLWVFIFCFGIGMLIGYIPFVIIRRFESRKHSRPLWVKYFK